MMFAFVLAFKGGETAFAFAFRGGLALLFASGGGVIAGWLCLVSRSGGWLGCGTGGCACAGWGGFAALFGDSGMETDGFDARFVLPFLIGCGNGLALCLLLFVCSFPFFLSPAKWFVSAKWWLLSFGLRAIRQSDVPGWFVVKLMRLFEMTMWLLESDNWFSSMSERLVPSLTVSA